MKQELNVCTEKKIEGKKIGARDISELTNLAKRVLFEDLNQNLLKPRL